MATPKNEDPVKGAAPFQVEGLSDIVDISLSYSGDRLLALKKDGTVWGMGYFPKTHKQMIDSFQVRFYPEYYREPAPIEGLTDADAVYTGNHTNAVIKKDGSLWMWGYDLHGTFGQAQSFQPIPTRVELSPDTE
ncbi:hypothetical protein [Paenibacillus solanacearum]|nr:hypothetical protein [Paenibacillus solanacearum]